MTTAYHPPATIDKRTVEVDVSQWIANPSGTANELKVGVDPSATDHAKVKGGEKSTVISVDLTDEARSVPYTVTNHDVRHHLHRVHPSARIRRVPRRRCVRRRRR